MRDFLSNEIALKVISVIVALVMWMYVMNEKNPQVTYVIRDVPVKLVNMNEDRFTLKDSSQEFFINVKVRGRRSIVVDLKPEDIDARANMLGRMEGKNLIPIRVSVPNNVELVDFSPREISIDLDKVVEEQFPVAVDLVGTPVKGYAAATPVVKPEAVVIRGPRSLLNSIKKVVCRVDISDKSTAITSNLPLRVLDDKGQNIKGVSIEPKMVEVTVPIVPVKRVSVKPDIRGNLADGFTIKDITCNPRFVEVTADKEVLETLESISTEPLSVQNSNRSIVRQLKLILPDNVKLLREDENTVTVTVEIEGSSLKTLNFSSNEIILENLPNNATGTVEQSDISLTIRGPNGSINGIGKSSVKLYADVSGLSEGEHTVNLKTEIVEPYTIIDIRPSNIKVTISNN